MYCSLLNGNQLNIFISTREREKKACNVIKDTYIHLEELSGNKMESLIEKI